MSDPVIIEMMQPDGKKSRVEVHYKPNGGIDLVFARSSQGEVLVMLPAYVVPRLKAALDQYAPEAITPALDAAIQHEQP